MRQLRYSVAASLDGYIAGPKGEFDWIVIDPDIDFEKMYRGFSGIVMGRKSYEVFAATGGSPIALPTYVYSRTLPEGERDGVTFAREAVPHVRRLKKSGGKKPLWLWGGGELFRELAEAGLVDGIDVAVIPVVLGGGIPLMPRPDRGCRCGFESSACTRRRERCSSSTTSGSRVAAAPAPAASPAEAVRRGRW